MQNQEIGSAKVLLLLGTQGKSEQKHGAHENAPAGQPTQNASHSQTDLGQAEKSEGQGGESERNENDGNEGERNEGGDGENEGTGDGGNGDGARREGELRELRPDLNGNDDDLFKHQLLNDAVEAAVMRYVGGTLDEHELQPEGAKRRADDLMSEYQWDRFLEEEVGFERTPPKKRRRKSYVGGTDIDPELAGLNLASEHDQLVHAAIMGAGELAKQLSLPPGTARARPAAGGDATAISQLAQAASTLSDKARRLPLRKAPLKKAPEPLAMAPRLKYEHTLVEQLVEHTAAEACLWYDLQADAGVGGPRLFLPQEIAILESFVEGYCQINHLTRTDICHRVWSTSRPKDRFWELLTRVFPYRSRASVYKHTRRQYHVFDIRAKWTKEEDELLRKLAETSVTNWKKVGEAMNRMPEDCRDRWRNYVKCGANRASNKWSEEEEHTLKNIVMEMLTADTHTLKDKPILINWTLVSERMNGVRLRIQCRYKWNKLLRRESLSRVSMMDPDTKLWLLNRLLESSYTDADAVDWDYYVHMYHEEHKGKSKVLWTTADFKVAFEKMRMSVRDSKTLPLHTTVSKLMALLIGGDESDPDPAKATPKPLALYDPMRGKSADERQREEQEAALVANAAVAAVSSGVNAQDAQHQEYSLWR